MGCKRENTGQYNIHGSMQKRNLDKQLNICLNVYNKKHTAYVVIKEVIERWMQI